MSASIATREFTYVIPETGHVVGARIHRVHTDGFTTIFEITHNVLIDDGIPSETSTVRLVRPEDLSPDPRELADGDNAPYPWPVTNLRLYTGRHDSSYGACCLMELINILDGAKWGDDPESVFSPLAEAGRYVNDNVLNKHAGKIDLSSRLSDLVPRLRGTANIPVRADATHCAAMFHTWMIQQVNRLGTEIAEMHRALADEAEVFPHHPHPDLSFRYMVSSGLYRASGLANSAMVDYQSSSRSGGLAIRLIEMAAIHANFQAWRNGMRPPKFGASPELRATATRLYLETMIDRRNVGRVDTYESMINQWHAIREIQVW